MWLVPITTSPTPSAGSRPPATPQSIRARTSKRSSSNDVATPAFTLPAPDSTNTASRPAMLPCQKLWPPMVCACPDWSERMGEFLRQSRYDAQKPACHGRMGYKVATPMSTSLPDRRTLRDACTTLARDAAREIMRIYAGDLGTRTKAD